MVSRDRSHVYEPTLALSSTTTPGDAASVKAGSHRWLLGVVQMDGIGSADWTLEDSADGSAFADVGLPPVTIAGVNSHVFVIDRLAFRQWVRLVSAANSGTPTMTAVYLKVENLETTITAGVNFTLVNGQAVGA